MTFNLSYIIATKNRLPFLKFTLENLIKNIEDGEEIIVVDGASTDGSGEYVHKLFQRGKIHQFISEPDVNQAHGWNKAMLMANGKFIKKIIDDDVFDFLAIRRCVNYMIINDNIDVVLSNELSVNLSSPENVSYNSRLPQFYKWKEGKTSCFTFSDVHLVIRKASLSFIGLYDTSFTMLDWEYSLRISRRNAKLAYYTGYNALSVLTPNNITTTVSKKILMKEAKIGQFLYGYPGDNYEITLWSKVKIFLGKVIFKKKTKMIQNADQQIQTLEDKYEKLYKTLTELNANIYTEFINGSK